MRVVDAAALTAAALLLSSVAGAQGLGDLAARQREKRKATGQPTRVITEDDIGVGVGQAAPASTPASPTPAPGGTAAPGQAQPAQTEGVAVPAAEAGAAEAEPAQDAAGTEAETEAEKPPTVEEQMEKELEERNKAQEAWRTQVSAAREEMRAYQDAIAKLQADLSDYRYGYNTPGRATRQSELEATQTKLADAQRRVESLEDSGRRAGYR